VSQNNGQEVTAVTSRIGSTEMDMTVYDDSEQVSTTDIIPYSALDMLVAPLRDGTNLPLHEQLLIHNYDNASREMLADAYYGREPKNIKAFAGRTVKVYGMMLYEQPGGWKGKDQLWHQEGYFQVRMLIEDSDTKGEPIVCVKSSGAGLARHVYHILNNRGWFLFEQPITYRVEIGEDNAHRILNVEQDLKKQLKGRAK